MHSGIAYYYPACFPSFLLHTQVPAQLEEDPSLHLTRGCHRPAPFAMRASAALLDSQARPHAARVLTTRPTLPEFSLESPLFGAILSRRLRLPLPLTSARCRCCAHLARVQRSERACRGRECGAGSPRRPPHGSHRQWPAVVRWRPARSRHNACLAPHCCRPPTQSWGSYCRSCLRCETCQRAHVPRTVQVQPLPAHSPGS